MSQLRFDDESIRYGYRREKEYRCFCAAAPPGEKKAPLSPGRGAGAAGVRDVCGPESDMPYVRLAFFSLTSKAKLKERKKENRRTFCFFFRSSPYAPRGAPLCECSRKPTSVIVTTNNPTWTRTTNIGKDGRHYCGDDKVVCSLSSSGEHGREGAFVAFGNTESFSTGTWSWGMG